MTRPGLVLDVDRSTPPITYWRDEQLTTERLPVGSRVIYPPEPIESVGNFAAALDAALANPLDGAPLTARLRAGMRLTIAVDDLVLPATSIDPRQRVLEAILDNASEARVDDVEIIIARGSSRRLTDSELKSIVGERVFQSFTLYRLLKQHDSEDATNLTALNSSLKPSTTINKRIAESDLVVYVSVHSPNGGGHQDISTGLVGFDLDTSSTTDAQLGLEQLDVFQVAIALDNATTSPLLSFTTKREPEWNIQDRATAAGVTALLAAAPSALRKEILRRSHRQPSVTGVFAGSRNAAQAEANSLVRLQTAVVAEAQADIVTIGVPQVGPYNTGAAMNPILAADFALTAATNPNGASIVSDGGAVLVHHPMIARFDPIQHPSYNDFFQDVLTQTVDAAQINDKFASAFATDDWYRHLYKTGYAYHGAHPIMTWSRISRALENVGAVVFIGANTETVHRLGFRAASTFADALEIARDVCKTAQPSIAHLHTPPAVTPVLD